MRILAIDPGNEQSAFCAMEDGRPYAFDTVLNLELLYRLRSGELGMITDLFAVEMIASYGMPVGKEVFDTCLWIGRFIEAWEARGGQAKLVYRREVKQFLCHTARANDANIRAALIDRYGPGKEKAVGVKKAPGPLYGVKGDVWSALAVAVTAEGIRAPAGVLVALPPADAPF